MDQAVDQLFDAMCQMRAGKTIRHLVERSTMSVADLQELQAILAEKLKRRRMRSRAIAYPG